MYTRRSSLCVSCADLLRLSKVPLGCQPASPTHLRECPEPGGAGQAPETSPSCCAQFQGSQGLAPCPRRLFALALASGASWKKPGGPTSTSQPSVPDPWGSGASFLATSPRVRCTLKVRTRLKQGRAPQRQNPEVKTLPLFLFFIFLSSRAACLCKAHVCFLRYTPARWDI